MRKATYREMLNNITKDNVAEMEEYGVRDLPALKEVLGKLFDKFVTGYKIDEFEIEGEGTLDLDLYHPKMGLGLRLCGVAHESIARTRYSHGYELYCVKGDMGSHWHPPEEWDVEMSVHANIVEAGRAFVTAYLANEIRRESDNICQESLRIQSWTVDLDEKAWEAWPEDPEDDRIHDELSECPDCVETGEIIDLEPHYEGYSRCEKCKGWTKNEEDE
jgi:hypothetical protein